MNKGGLLGLYILGFNSIFNGKPQPTEYKGTRWVDTLCYDELVSLYIQIQEGTIGYKLKNWQKKAVVKEYEKVKND